MLGRASMKINSLNFSNRITQDAYDQFVEDLGRHLADGNTITFKNIGTFSTVTKPAKKMVVGGVLKEVPEAVKIKFKQSRNFNPKQIVEKEGNKMDKLLKEMQN